MDNEDEFIGKVGAMLMQLALMLACSPSARSWKEQLQRRSVRRRHIEVRTESNRLLLVIETEALPPAAAEDSREPEKPLARTDKNQLTPPAKKSRRMPAAKRRLPENKRNSN